MTSNSFPGGRAKKAPYLSTHIRVPDTIKTKLGQVVDIYKKLLAGDHQIGLANFDIALDKFVEGCNPLYGVTADDFRLVDARQYDDLNVLYNAMLSKSKALKSEIETLEFRKKEAARILRSSLKLRANSGGAIKREVEKALGELGEDF
jgi:hypothetical protein